MADEKKSEMLLLGEIQVLLAEKVTYYTIIRAGLTIITVPLTIIVFLLATTEYHGLFDRFWLSFVVVVGLLSMSASGIFLTLKARKKIKKIDQFVESIEEDNKRIADLIV